MLCIKANFKVWAIGLGQVGFLKLGLIGDPLKKRENGREIAALNPVVSGIRLPKKDDFRRVFQAGPIICIKENSKVGATGLVKRSSEPGLEMVLFY